MIVVRGKSSDKVSPTVFSIDDNLAKNLDEAIKRNKRGWDYVCIVTGLPGVGKSTFSRYIARYLDEKFDGSHVYFDANEFIEQASKDELMRSQVLDESFKDLGTNAVKSKEYFELINWLQLSRQKRGFIILILPDFFSLSKTLAIFRSSHLFVVYEDDDGERAFAAFDREAKKNLWIHGKQNMNYNATRPSFRGRFTIKCSKGDIIDEDEYDRKKLAHLNRQNKEMERMGKDKVVKDKLITHLFSELSYPPEKIAEIGGISRASVYNSINRLRRFEDRVKGESKEDNPDKKDT